MAAEELVCSFVQYAQDKFTQNLTQIVRCTDALTDEQIWRRPNERTNSVGNLVLHLTGNVRQWLLAGVGGQPFERDRAKEFAARGPLPRAQLAGPLEAAVRDSVALLAVQDETALIRRCDIQGYAVTAAQAVFHAVEHFSFHTGQIVLLTKWIADTDLSVYNGGGHKLAGFGALP